MGAMEIVLLIAGAILFIVSFLIPGQGEPTSEETKAVAREEIRDMIDREMGKIQSHVDDVVGEAIDYAMEKTERSLERLSNEKIMAVSGYSDTVLAEIHKSQEEIMFLYDMLNDKHTNLKNTVSKVTETVREAEQAADKVGAVVNTMRQLEEQKPIYEEPAPAVFLQRPPWEREQPAAEPAAVIPDFSVSETEREIPVAEPVGTEPVSALEAELRPEPEPRTALPAFVRLGMPGAVPTLPAGAQTVAEPTPQSQQPAVQPLVQGRGNMGGKKEQILAMRRQGMDTITIARELALGVGEVQLILGLFEN